MISIERLHKEEEDESLVMLQIDKFLIQTLHFVK